MKPEESRSIAHASASGLRADDFAEFGDVQQITIPEPSDWISRHAKMRMSERAQALELVREPFQYSANLTERDIQRQREEAASIRALWIAKALGGLCVLAVVALLAKAAGWV